MKIDLETIKLLELKLAEYSKENGTIAEHESANSNCRSSCASNCSSHCKGSCKYVCADGLTTNVKH